MSDYTQAMRRHDYDTFNGLLDKQRELYRQLEVLTQDLRTQAGKAHDHAAGFQHKPETCATCAACTPLDLGP